jgi:hypothetical protein
MAEKITLALLIRTKEDRNYFHVFADFVRLTKAPNGDWLVRNPGMSSWEDDNSFHSLQVSSQGNSTTGADDRETTPEQRKLYGWEIEYREPISVRLREAERMAKTLRTIHRKLDKLREKYGDPPTYGAFLLRVADAVGAIKIIAYADPHRIRSSYDDNDYRFMSLDIGARHVDNLEHDWKEKGRKEEPAEIAN